MKIYYYDKDEIYENLSVEYKEFYDLINKKFIEDENFKLVAVNFNAITEVFIYCKKFNYNYSQTICFGHAKYLDNLKAYLTNKFYVNILPYLIEKDNENRLNYC